MARSRSRMLLYTYSALFVAVLLIGTNTASAQFDDGTFIYDTRLAIKLELNGRTVAQAPEGDPIIVDMEEPMDLYLQVNNTHTAPLNLSGVIWFYYQGIALFPIEVRDPASNSTWVEIPDGVNIPPVVAPLDFSSILSLGVVDLLTGKFQASLNFTYHVVGETEYHTLGQEFFLIIPADPVSVITSVTGIITAGATVTAVYGAGTGIYQLFDGIQTAHKVRSIQKKASEIRSLPNLTVLGALPALFALVAGMTKIKRKKKDEESEEDADMITEYRLRQRLREAAPDAWPMDRCPKCTKKWNKKRNECKKCNIDESEARRQYAELLVGKTTRALRVFNKSKSLSVRKLAKKTKSTDYNAGVIGAAMVDTELTEIQKIATPLKSFVMNIGGLAFVVLTWQQLLGGAHSQWQTTLTVVGAALSLAVIVALYFTRKSQIAKLEAQISVTPAAPEEPEVVEEPPAKMESLVSEEKEAPTVGYAVDEETEEEESPDFSSEWADEVEKPEENEEVELADVDESSGDEDFDDSEAF
ncbi:MAG: hypothetical protein JSW61_07470 [Candidatus Thorarchaeota archaeon]|nr:MAG: hypothetical protein JSW61_07470 [Candidatus Thorarchaeota archaeon]